MHIDLTEEQKRRLTEIARSRSTSVESLIEEAIRRFLQQDDYESRAQRALSVVGKYHLGASDLADNHDKYYVDSAGNGLQ